MKHFKTKEELIKEWETNGSCKEQQEFNKSCKDLQEILETCPLEFRLWRIKKGYLQFVKHCKWEMLNGANWCELLIEQPHFAEKCDWRKLSGFHWLYILKHQPQFKKYAPKNKTNQ